MDKHQTVNYYAKNIYILNKDFPITEIAKGLRLTRTELKKKIEDEKLVEKGDWVQLTKLICFNQVTRSEK